MAQARLILEQLRRNEVTHVVGVPDNASKALLTLLQGDESIHVLGVTREGEAFAVASGLWVGGRRPIVLIQNTGLLEAGDALRGTAMRMRVPLVCLITYRGYAKLAASGLAVRTEALDGPLLSRPDLDSSAVLTEPTLRAWGVPYDFLNDDQDLPRIADAFQRAEQLQQAVAVLVTQDMT